MKNYLLHSTTWQGRAFLPVLFFLLNTSLMHAATYTWSSGAKTLSITLGTAESLTVSVSGGNTTFTLNTGTFTQSGGNTATGSGTTAITLAAADITASLTINNTGAGAGTNTTTFTGGTITSTTILVQLDAANATGVASFTTAVTQFASITATIRVNQRVTANNAASGLTTISGDLLIEANWQEPRTLGSFSGVSVGGIIKTTGSGTVTIRGRAGDGNSGLIGVNVADPGRIEGGSSGLLTVHGIGSSGTGFFNQGVRLNGADAIITSTGGNVFVKGQGGGSTTGSDGVSLTNGGTISAGGSGTVTIEANTGTAHGSGIYAQPGYISSAGGNIMVTALAGGAGADGSCIGVSLQSASSISAAGSGSITINGTGGNGSGSLNCGLYSSNSSSITTNSGDISLVLQGGSGSSPLGLFNRSGCSITTTSGDISISTSSIELESGSSVSTGSTGQVTLRPKASNAVINLISGSDFGDSGMHLSDSELDRITTGTLIIGDATSGDITFNTGISRSANTAMQLLTAGDITFTSGGINTAGGDLLLDCGPLPKAIKPNLDGTEVGCGTLSFGSALSFDINGSTPGSGSGTYAQLGVVGMINLTGVDLVLSGAHIPTSGQTFIIVNNDGSDAITGTFNGLPEGATIANFLGGSRPATISYVGGTGNDVVLTAGGDYSISTAGNVLTITDNIGNGDMLAVTEDGTGIRFNVTNTVRTYSLNGSAPANFPVTVPNLATFTSIVINAAGGTDEVSISSGFATSLPNLTGITINGGADDLTFVGNMTLIGAASYNLALNSDANITLQQSTSGGMPVNTTVTATGNVTVATSGYSTSGGNFASSGVAFTMNGNPISTGGGNVTLTHTDNVTATATTYGGSFTSSGKNFTSINAGINTSKSGSPGGNILLTHTGYDILHQNIGVATGGGTYTAYGKDITIQDGGLNTSRTGFTGGAASLTASGNVLLKDNGVQTGGGSINVSGVDITSQGSGLNTARSGFAGGNITLIASGNFISKNTGMSSGGGDINITASGNVEVLGGGASTCGSISNGHFTSSGVDMTMTSNPITTCGGNVALTHTGNVTAIAITNGGSFTSSGKNFTSINSGINTSKSDGAGGNVLLTHTGYDILHQNNGVQTGGGTYTAYGKDITIQDGGLSTWRTGFAGGAVSMTASGNIVAKNNGVHTGGGSVNASSVDITIQDGGMNTSRSGSVGGDITLTPSGIVLIKNSGLVTGGGNFSSTSGTDITIQDGGLSTFNAGGGTGTVGIDHTGNALLEGNGISANGAVTFKANSLDQNARISALSTVFINTPNGTSPKYISTDVTATALSFASGSDLNIAINGTVPGNGSSGSYRQLTVIGTVNLTGVDLVISGTTSLGTCPQFIIVSNDDSDPVTGTFNGLAEGATFPNFLGTGLTAYITYVGGTGNDVAIKFPDTDPPFVTCPTNPITVNTIGASGCQVNIPDFVAMLSPSDCTGPVTEAQNIPAGPYNTAGHGTTVTVAYTATDASSPANTTTCTITLTVSDVQNPSIICPSNITRNTDANQCTAVVFYTNPTFSDNCGATIARTGGPASGSAFPKGMNMVDWKATDGGGNMALCQFTVTVLDAQPPSIVCPANIVRSTDAGLCTAAVTYATPTATDNCGSASVILVSAAGTASGSIFPKGVTTVTWQASDTASPANVTACTFTVTVNDNQLPSISCPSNITQGNTPDQCSAIVNYTAPTASDNCLSVGVAIQSGLPSGDNFPKGLTTVVWRATDGAGLTKTCSFRVTVNDTQAPSIACPSSQNLNTAPNLCNTTATYATPTATDNCTPPPTVVRISGPSSGSTFSLGNTTVIWRAIDGAGRSSTCSFVVTVVDATPPVITCPNNVAVTGSGSPCTAVASYTTPTATDNCGIQSVFLLSGLPSGASFQAGVTMNTWRAVDNSGQSADCAFTVTVNCGASPDPSEGGESVTAERVASPPLRGGRVGLLLSPNPAVTEVQISTDNLSESGGTLTVRDAHGRVVVQNLSVVADQVLRIGLEDLALGVYFITLRSEEGMMVTKRLVKVE